LQLNKKEPISFRKIIPAGSTVILTERVKDAGTIEELSARFYQGQQKSLHVIPMVIHASNIADSIVTYPADTDKFLSGDDDYFIFKPVISVHYDDVIQITAINEDAVNDYSLCIDVTIDYFGGVNRVVGVV
jgi:hypothetical protein